MHLVCTLLNILQVLRMNFVLFRRTRKWTINRMEKSYAKALWMFMSTVSYQEALRHQKQSGWGPEKVPQRTCVTKICRTFGWTFCCDLPQNPCFIGYCPRIVHKILWYCSCDFLALGFFFGLWEKCFYLWSRLSTSLGIKKCRQWGTHWPNEAREGAVHHPVLFSAFWQRDPLHAKERASQGPSLCLANLDLDMPWLGGTPCSLA